MVRFQLSDYSSVWRLLYWRRLLWKSQYHTDAEMKALQWKLLSRILDHCFENVPYYRDRLRRLGLSRSDFNSLEDLTKLPVITKNDVRENAETLKAVRFSRYRPKPMRTTGTTGSPMQVYWDLNSNVLELVCTWRHYSWFGYRLGTPFLDLRNYRDHLTGRWAWNWKCRGLETSIRFWDESNVGECARMLRKRKIRLWRGNPMAIHQMSRCLDRAGIRDVKPDCIITVGDTLLDHERNFIETWAGIRIGDSYGLTEHTAFICQCPAGSYHIAPEYGILEILREDGTPAESGEEGRIVSTGLHNLAFPLLRYDTGDSAVQSEGICACGRTLPIVKEFTGRIADRVLDGRGRLVSSLHRSFKSVNGIRCSQIVQEQSETLDVYIIPARDFDPDSPGWIVEKLQRALGDGMTVRVRLVEKLPFPSSKKFRFVVNRMKDLPER